MMQETIIPVWLILLTVILLVTFALLHLKWLRRPPVFGPEISGDQISEGDLILFRTVGSVVIPFSFFTHAAIAIKGPDNNIYCAEIDVNPALSFLGESLNMRIRLVYIPIIEQQSRTRGSFVSVRKLNRPLSPAQNQILWDQALQMMHKSIKYDDWNLPKHVLHHLGLPYFESHLFSCTRLVAYLMNEAEIFPLPEYNKLYFPSVLSSNVFNPTMNNGVPFYGPEQKITMTITNLQQMSQNESLLD